MDMRRRLDAAVPSEHSVVASHVISRDQLSTGAGANAQSEVPTDDGDTFTDWLAGSDLVTAGPSGANAQPPLSTAAPDNSAASVCAESDRNSTSSEIHVPTPTALSPINVPAKPEVPTQALAQSNNTAAFALPASFDVNAYSAAGANAHNKAVFPASFNVNAYSSARAEAHSKPVAVANSPTQALPQNKNTAVSTLPTSFNVNGYSSAGAKAHSTPVMKDGGGLVSSPSTI